MITEYMPLKSRQTCWQTIILIATTRYVDAFSDETSSFGGYRSCVWTSADVQLQYLIVDRAFIASRLVLFFSYVLHQSFSQQHFLESEVRSSHSLQGQLTSLQREHSSHSLQGQLTSLQREHLRVVAGQRTVEIRNHNCGERSDHSCLYGYF
jgi:hypothetical protein